LLQIVTLAQWKPSVLQCTGLLRPVSVVRAVEQNSQAAPPPAHAHACRVHAVRSGASLRTRW
jgi:hypothetical protein